MSQTPYRANLSAKSFPFLSSNFGRTVIVRQADNTYDREISSTKDDDRDVGIPQVYYCENVMPTAQGLQSIGFRRIISPAGSGDPFIEIFSLRDDQGRKADLGITTSGKFLINTGSGWIYKNTYPSTNKVVTTAYVSGVTYIWIQHYGCIKYDFAANVFVSVILTGISIPDILGITSSAGYLIVYNNTSGISWSSTIDPTDFIPSLISGAGSGQVEGARGAITCVAPHIQGFIVYTSENAIAAIYTSNARYPFAFREIVSSGGLASARFIAIDSTTGNHYCYTTSGFQIIAVNGAQTIFPALTDYVAGQLFEQYNRATTEFSYTVINSPNTLQKMINIIANRYMVVSCGVESLTHAVIYDMVFERWGKVVVDHVDTFEFSLPTAAVNEIPRQSIGFLKANGEIVVIDFSVAPAINNSYGVLLLGKYQYVRSRNIIIDEIELEDILPTGLAKFQVWASLDGKNISSKVNYDLLGNLDFLKKYAGRAEGVNVSLLLQGSFNLNTVQLKFHLGGKR